MRRLVRRLGSVSTALVVMNACHGVEQARTPLAAYTRLQGADALKAQAVALRAHVEASSVPSGGPDGPAQICVGIATMPAGPYAGRVEATSDPPEAMIAALRLSRPNLRALSECGSKRADNDITLAIGWPVATQGEIVVAIDRVCWWTCASGYKVRLRRAKDGFEFLAQA